MKENLLYVLVNFSPIFGSHNGIFLFERQYKFCIRSRASGSPSTSHLNNLYDRVSSSTAVLHSKHKHQMSFRGYSDCVFHQIDRMI